LEAPPWCRVEDSAGVEFLPASNWLLQPWLVGCIAPHGSCVLVVAAALSPVFVGGGVLVGSGDRRGDTGLRAVGQADDQVRGQEEGVDSSGRTNLVTGKRNKRRAARRRRPGDPGLAGLDIEGDRPGHGAAADGAVGTRPARQARRPPGELIHHSDAGSQYTSVRLTEFLAWRRSGPRSGRSATPTTTR